MIPMLRFTCVCVVVAARAAHAQAPSPAADPVVLDSSTQVAVTTFSVRSGKIALASAANPGPVYLPDGTYTNESSTIIVVLDGKIARLQTSTGEIKEISSVRMNRQNVILLTPSTNALMQVTDIRLPSGTFKSEDGRNSMSVLGGRPTGFTLPASSP
ncbi:MAG: hypothetical protein ABIQ55_08550 [Gemmatimonadaceae bacterium]